MHCCCLLQAEKLSNVVVTALESTAEADITKEQAVKFFDTVHPLWQGLCAGVVSGQAAAVA